MPSPTDESGPDVCSIGLRRAVAAHETVFRLHAERYADAACEDAVHRVDVAPPLPKFLAVRGEALLDALLRAFRADAGFDVLFASQRSRKTTQRFPRPFASLLLYVPQNRRLALASQIHRVRALQNRLDSWIGLQNIAYFDQAEWRAVVQRRAARDPACKRLNDARTDSSTLVVGAGEFLDDVLPVAVGVQIESGRPNRAEATSRRDP